MRAFFALVFVGLLAGCLDAGTDRESDQQDVTDEVNQPTSGISCEPADKSNRGTSLNGAYYQEGAELWEESNGVTNLQKSETCEGPADTRIA